MVSDSHLLQVCHRLSTAIPTHYHLCGCIDRDIFANDLLIACQLVAVVEASTLAESGLVESQDSQA